MNILVIGNGFDLWHGLPTRYSDFLNFIKIIKKLLSSFNEKEGLTEGHIHSLIRACPLLESIFVNPDSNGSYLNLIEEIMPYLKRNCWLDFLKTRSVNNKNWIGFEGEISKVIIAFYSYYSNIELFKYDRDAQSLLNDFSIASKGTSYRNYTENQLTNRLLKDLNQVIRCLEVYLCLCLEAVPVHKRLSCILGLKSIDKVLSFNYTNTFERVYESCFPEKPEYCYIHGRASLTNSIDSNNMVLGIDEFLDPVSRDSGLEYVGFKKYYQRILNQTDYNYTQWLKERSEKNIYVIGHSLDSTDQDVLRDLFLQDRFNNAEVKLSPDHVRIKVFYHSRENNAAQIKNLVKVLGYDNLNALARGADLYRNIEFLPLE